LGEKYKINLIYNKNGNDLNDLMKFLLEIYFEEVEHSA